MGYVFFINVVRCADNIAVFNEKTKQMEEYLNSLNLESLKVGLRIHKGKKKIRDKLCRQWICTLIDQEKIIKWQKSNTSHKPHLSKMLQKENSVPGSEQHRAVLDKTRKYCKIDSSPYHWKKKLWTNLSYQQWPMAARHGLFNKQLTNKELLKVQWRGKC